MTTEHTPGHRRPNTDGALFEEYTRGLDDGMEHTTLNIVAELRELADAHFGAKNWRRHAVMELLNAYEARQR
jgi:hypothetical protein